MKQIRAIIVDDEESARDVLANLLSRFCPGVEVVEMCGSVPEAAEVIKRERPDLVFLDIAMPRYAGYELVKFLETIEFSIIFVTAYDQYAIKAFELAALDYLLKPVEIERLKQAVARAGEKKDWRELEKRLDSLTKTITGTKPSNLVINEKGIQHLFPLEQVVAIEAQESYCTLHLEGGKQLMVSKNLKHFETLLENCEGFFRAHKSWVVNLKHLKSYSKAGLVIQLSGGIEAKLSRYQKAEFEAALNGKWG